MAPVEPCRSGAKECAAFAEPCTTDAKPRAARAKLYGACEGKHAALDEPCTNEARTRTARVEPCTNTEGISQARSPMRPRIYLKVLRNLRTPMNQAMTHVAANIPGHRNRGL